MNTYQFGLCVELNVALGPMAIGFYEVFNFVRVVFFLLDFFLDLDVRT